MSTRQYTDKQKAAYYKRIASAKPKAVTGRGAYKPRRTVKRRAPARASSSHSPLWGTAGGALSSALGLGPGLGQMGGNALGSVFKAITGRGDYVQNSSEAGVINNSLYTSDPMMPPIINPYDGPGDIYRRSEYIRDIITSPTIGAFSLTSYDVNPGLESSFEWLSQVAANYEEYSIRGLYYEFRSMSADALNSTNTALGQVIMAASYNANNPVFTNKQMMENYQGGISAKPSINMRFFLECAKNQSVLDELYVRANSVPEGQDQRLYDLAKFQVATNGFQAANVNVGELWVCYEVVLRKPKLFSALGNYASFSSSGNLVYSNAAPIGTSTTINSSSNNISGLAFTGNTIAWDAPNLPQAYQFQVYWIGAGAVALTYPTITYSNGAAQASLLEFPNATTNSTKGFLQINVSYSPSTNLTNGKPTLTFSGTGTLPTTQIQCNVAITQIPNVVLGL